MSWNMTNKYFKEVISVLLSKVIKNNFLIEQSSLNQNQNIY